MNRKAEWILVVVVAVFTLFACSYQNQVPSDNKDRLALNTAAEAYAITVSALADYRSLGLIDEDEAEDIEIVRIRCRAALDAWRDGLDTHHPSARMWQHTFNDALSKLIKAQQQAEVLDE